MCRKWTEQLHAHDCYQNVTECSTTSGHRTLHQMYIQLVKYTAQELWVRLAEAVQQACHRRPIRCCTLGLAHHVFCRTCKLRWCEQMKHSCHTLRRALALYAAIGWSTWPVTSTHTGHTSESGKQQYKQWHWQIKPFCHVVARIALAIE